MSRYRESHLRHHHRGATGLPAAPSWPQPGQQLRCAVRSAGRSRCRLAHIRSTLGHYYRSPTGACWHCRRGAHRLAAHDGFLRRVAGDPRLSRVYPALAGIPRTEGREPGDARRRTALEAPGAYLHRRSAAIRRRPPSSRCQTRPSGCSRALSPPLASL